MPITPQQALAAFAEAECLHDAATVHRALDRMSDAIAAELKDADPLVITVMQGGIVTAGMLIPRLDFPLQLDYLHATRYTGETRGGEVRWIARPVQSLADRVVLLVDDIYDEGHTLAAIVRACEAEGARRVLSAVLLDKQHARKAAYRPDFVGLPVADRYVFGMGMDYREYLRNAPGIFAIREDHG